MAAPGCAGLGHATPLFAHGILVKEAIGVGYAFNEDPDGGEALGASAGGSEDQPEASTTFRGELQSAGTAFIKLGQRSDDGGDSLTT